MQTWGTVRDRFSTPGGVYNATPSRIVFGAGSSAQIASEVERLGCSRAMIISTPGRGTMADRVAGLLGERSAGVYPKAVSQIPIELAHAARTEAAARGADCLVSVGGGAAIGVGKSIALESGIPLIAVPTTYSGSEMTGFCGITIDGVKRMHESLNMLARTVIYDPELTVSLPARAGAPSAMNALAHCVEALYVETASPIVRAAALEAARAIGAAMPRVVREPANIEARSEALYGAYLAGAALTGGFALEHGLAHVLGGTFGIAHGDAHSIAVPYVTAYNIPAAPDALAAFADALGADDAATGLFDFAEEIGAPVRLRDYGLNDADLDRCARIVVETDSGLNPRQVDSAGVRAILSWAFDGVRPEPSLVAASSGA